MSLRITKKSKSRRNAKTGDSVLSDQSSFDYTEAYVRLRTNFVYATLGGTYKKILFTSCEQGEGKSTTVLNLAISLAKSGWRVLLLDCDIRRSYMHTYVKGKKGMGGLTDILCKMKRVEECLQHNDKYGFDIIYSGQAVPNPSELLGSDRMKRLLEVMESRYDYILLDAPPVLVVSDPLILSPLADGVVFLVRQNIIKSKQYAFALKSLEKVGARMLGTVMNMYRSEKDNYSYGYGNKYYKKYYSSYSGYSSYSKKQ